MVVYSYNEYNAETWIKHLLQATMQMNLGKKCGMKEASHKILYFNLYKVQKQVKLINVVMSASLLFGEEESVNDQG